MGWVSDRGLWSAWILIVEWLGNCWSIGTNSGALTSNDTVGDTGKDDNCQNVGTKSGA